MLTREQLKLEISNDPAGLGLLAFAQKGDVNGLTEALNSVRDGAEFVVGRGIVPIDVFIQECFALGVFQNLFKLADPEKIKVWVFYLEAILPLLTVGFNVNSPVFDAQVAEMLVDGLVDKAGANSLQFRQGSRAQVLGVSNIDSSEISAVLGVA